jgi:hypothetical protein
VNQLATALRDRYVFPEVGEQAAARIAAALAAGEYDGLDQAAFAARLHADVAAIAHDKHLNIGWQGGPRPGRARRPAPGPLPRAEAGVVRADRLAGGIGYSRGRRLPSARRRSSPRSTAPWPGSPAARR